MSILNSLGNVVITLLLLFVGLLVPSRGYAQAQVGSISIEIDGASKSPYESSQDEAIEYFENFLSALPGVHSSSVPTARVLSKGAAQYLAAVNLFCTLRYGSCPTLLQAMYEVEAAYSVANGKAECPNLNNMWKAWVDADMERRVDLDLKIGFVKVYDEFKAGPRRKYIRCSSSIQTLLSSVDDKNLFFRTRYDDNATAVGDLRGTVKFLKSIQAEIPNLFARMGLSS